MVCYALKSLYRPTPIPPLPPGEGRVRAKQGQGERLGFLDPHTLICKLLQDNR